MKNQIFKTIIQPEILWDFIRENCEETEECYIFNKSLYKKAIFRDTITPFTKSLDDYYYESKKHYVRRKMDYIKFITIIRQLCNSIGIKYETKLVYNNSTYEIVYSIYMGATLGGKPPHPLVASPHTPIC
jgi:hypothetical protein